MPDVFIWVYKEGVRRMIIFLNNFSTLLLFGLLSVILSECIAGACSPSLLQEGSFLAHLARLILNIHVLGLGASYVLSRSFISRLINEHLPLDKGAR